MDSVQGIGARTKKSRTPAVHGVDYRAFSVSKQVIKPSDCPQEDSVFFTFFLKKRS